MVFNAFFNNNSVSSWRSTTDLPQATEKHYHIMLHTLVMGGIDIRNHNFSGDMYWLYG
jgi:hypothetical protein